MKLEDKKFEITPAGTHTAVLYCIADLGTQKTLYNGETKFARKLWFGFELPEEKMEDGRPFAIGGMFTQSTHEKARLAILIKQWTGDIINSRYSLKGLLGKAGNATVVHTEAGDKVYANLSALSPLKKNEVAPQSINPWVYFDLDDYQQSAFDALPNFLQEKIKASPEYVEVFRAPADMPDEVPF